MQRSAPFARSAAIMALVQAAIGASVGDMAKRNAMLAGIPAYVSRGKGEGRGNRSARGAGMANHRAALKSRRIKAHRARARG